MNSFTLRSRLITLILLLSLSAAACQPLAVSTAALSPNQGLAKLVGSWQVETTVVKQGATFPALLTFTSDGIVIADEPPIPAFCNTNPFFAADAKVATPGVYTLNDETVAKLAALEAK